MKAKTHSILTVVNASADVERCVRERVDGDADPQLGENNLDQSKSRLPSRIAEFKQDNRDSVQSDRLGISWGILFGSEYIWAPDIGSMLIVWQAKTATSPKPPQDDSSRSTLFNCCIVQFENQLSTRSSLRIFHSY